MLKRYGSYTFGLRDSRGEEWGGVVSRVAFHSRILTNRVQPAPCFVFKGCIRSRPAVSNLERDGAAGTLPFHAACSLRAEVGFTPNQRLVAMPKEASLD